MTDSAENLARRCMELGVALAGQGRMEEAANLFHQAVQWQPTYAEAHSNLATILLAQGRLPEAIVCYENAVSLAPDNARAHYNLAVALQQQVRLPEAEASYRQALRLDPSLLDAWMNLGAVQQKSGDLDAANAAYREVVRLQPDSAKAYSNLGSVLLEQGRPDEAIHSYQQAIWIDPNLAHAHYNLGKAFADQGRLDEAVVSYQEAIRIQPQYVEAYLNLGNALASQSRFEDAIAVYYRALHLKPDYVDAYVGLAAARVGQEQFEEALSCCQETIRLKPDSGETYYNLGRALVGLERLEEAVTAYRQAIALKPDQIFAHNNLGSTLAALGRLGEAESAYQQALALDPDYADGHYNLSLLLLLQGLFEPGWAEYEWRWRRSGMQPRVFSQPRWDGAALPAGTILLLAEQGLGDTLHFLRYARLVRQRVGRVVLECQPALLSLARSCPGLTQVLAQGEPLPAFDVQAPLLSLPGLFHTNLASIPAEVPYLTADPARVAYWRQHLAHESRFRVGLVWQGNPQFQRDRQRSIPLREFAPLARVDGIALLSLQVGAGSEQLATAILPLSDLGSRLDPYSLADLAGLLVNLDLLVSVDTAPAHLAGALGLPVWIALPTVPDWRWLLDRTESPWYPTARLFRQQHIGNWTTVFEQIAIELEKTVRC